MKLIQTKDYLLWVDEGVEIKENDLMYNEKLDIIINYKSYNDGCVKIIGHYPLTKEAKELDLPELPSFEKVNIKELAEKEFPSLPDIKYKGDKENEKNKHLLRAGFVVGYKAAQSKQFTLEDMRKGLSEAFKAQQEGYNITADEIIQSLSTQQLPKEFIPEYQKDWEESTKMFMESMGDNPEDFKYEETLKTITNSEGKEVLVGTYKY